MENILLINLLGKRFRIPSRIVANYPQTLLGDPNVLKEYYREISNDYYFPRSPILFPYILTYYTLEKKIFCPSHIPVELLENECQFFQLKNATIYDEINRMDTYQYFSFESNQRKKDWIHSISLLIGLLFMISISLEAWKPSTMNSESPLWTPMYIIELLGTLLLTISILCRLLLKIQNEPSLPLDLFCSLLSLIIIGSETLFSFTDYRRRSIFIMICKTCRLPIIVGHLKILKLILLTFINQLETIFILVFINIVIVGALSEIAFAFERRQEEEQALEIKHSTMRTHLDAFWWATSLSFTIGFGHTDPHSTLTTVGRLCGYFLTFFGLLFNGLILQELIKGFLIIDRADKKY